MNLQCLRKKDPKVCLLSTKLPKKDLTITVDQDNRSTLTPKLFLELGDNSKQLFHYYWELYLNLTVASCVAISMSDDLRP